MKFYVKHFGFKDKFEQKYSLQSLLQSVEGDKNEFRNLKA